MSNLTPYEKGYLEGLKMAHACIVDGAYVELSLRIEKLELKEKYGTLKHCPRHEEYNSTCTNCHARTVEGG